MRESRFSCKATYLSVSLRSKKDSKSEFAASPSKGKLFVQCENKRDTIEYIEYLLSFTKNDRIFIFQLYSRSITLVRVFHKLPEIFQKVSFNFSKKEKKAQKLLEKKQNNQKMLFITKAAQMLLGKIKTFCGLVLNYANCTTKGRFLSIFVQFCGVTSVAK